jgi:carboxylate-amine ligase
VQGIQPYFIDTDDCYKRPSMMLGSDVAPDADHISWTARLSDHSPTMEVRTAVAQLTAGEAVPLDLTDRAPVETSIRTPGPEGCLQPELLDPAVWQTATHGPQCHQLDPETGDKLHSGLLVASLLRHSRDGPSEYGDVELVESAMDRILRVGDGARRQRESMAPSGIARFISDAVTVLTAEQPTRATRMGAMLPAHVRTSIRADPHLATSPACGASS